MIGRRTLTGLAAIAALWCAISMDVEAQTDQFFDGPVYKELALGGAVDGRMIRPDLANRRLSRYQVGLMARARFESMAGELDIELKDVTKALFEGRLNITINNPDVWESPADLDLVFVSLHDPENLEGLPPWAVSLRPPGQVVKGSDEWRGYERALAKWLYTQRELAWNTRYGAITDLVSVRTKIMGRATEMTAMDLLLRYHMRDLGSVDFKGSYAVERNPAHRYRRLRESLRSRGDMEAVALLDQALVRYAGFVSAYRFFSRHSGERADQRMNLNRQYLELRAGYLAEWRRKTKEALLAQYQEGLDAIEQGEYARAVSLLRRAAGQGQLEAQKSLANLFLSGEVVTRDDHEAARWLREAAGQKDSEAQYLLATLYERGQGVPKKRSEAMRLHSLASNQGHVKSMVRLARLLMQIDQKDEFPSVGAVKPGTMAEAIQLLRRSAGSGSVAASTLLAPALEYDGPNQKWWEEENQRQEAVRCNVPKRGSTYTPYNELPCCWRGGVRVRWNECRHNCGY